LKEICKENATIPSIHSESTSVCASTFSVSINGHTIYHLEPHWMELFSSGFRGLQSINIFSKKAPQIQKTVTSKFFRDRIFMPQCHRNLNTHNNFRFMLIGVGSRHFPLCFIKMAIAIVFVCLQSFIFDVQSPKFIYFLLFLHFSIMWSKLTLSQFSGSSCGLLLDCRWVTFSISPLPS
jgi:hypothetical protein